jgi:hypothetical protein
VRAYKAFLEANSAKMKVPVLAPKVLQELDRPRAENKFTPIKEQPSYLVGGKLMPFQMDGVNFLFLYVCRARALASSSVKLTFPPLLFTANGGSVRDASSPTRW